VSAAKEGGAGYHWRTNAGEGQVDVVDAVSGCEHYLGSMWHIKFKLRVRGWMLSKLIRFGVIR
jgi:hypothetical protein